MNWLSHLAALIAVALLLAAPGPALSQVPPKAPAPVARATPGHDIVGHWTAEALGQTVTADFTRQGDMIYGVVVIPDPISGGSNTYHVAGVILGDEFAAQHASGHLLKGAMVGPNEAQAVFTPKSGPPLNLVLKRRHAP